jgi:hypothetical protein
MQDKHTFEYAVIRIVPQVEREEFMNVGVVLYSRPRRFLQSLIHLDKQRLWAFSNKMDVEEVAAYLQAFERICGAAQNSGPIGRLDAASRFRWLTAVRSTVVQTSRVHPGLCAHPQKALEKLYRELVL